MRIALSLSVVFFAIEALATAGAEVKSRDRLSQSLEAGEIDRVEIIAIPPSVESIAQISAADLEKQWIYKITINRFSSTRWRKEWSQVLTKSSIVPTTRVTVDIRWECAFFNRDGVRVSVLRLNGSGTSGQFDSEKVQYDEAPIRLLRKMFAGLVK